MASARDGGTPNPPHVFARQISNGGPALISEFNPINEELRSTVPDNAL